MSRYKNCFKILGNYTFKAFSFLVQDILLVLKQTQGTQVVMNNVNCWHQSVRVSPVIMTTKIRNSPVIKEIKNTRNAAVVIMRPITQVTMGRYPLH